MTDYERGYEHGKADAENGIETYREGILVGPCFCGKWPGGVPPLRHWAGLTDEEVKDFQVNKFIGPNIIRAIERRLKEKNA